MHEEAGEEFGRVKPGLLVVRASTIVMIGFAVVFGLLAVFIAQIWLHNQANMRAKNTEPKPTQVASQTVVVARQSLRFGTEINASMLQEVPSPAQVTFFVDVPYERADLLTIQAGDAVDSGQKVQPTAGNPAYVIASLGGAVSSIFPQTGNHAGQYRFPQ